jgi:predicted transcriptional regulator
MKITSVALPDELSDRIDQAARDVERSRSWMIRKLLARSITGENRTDPQAFADAEPSKLKRTSSK